LILLIRRKILVMEVVGKMNKGNFGRCELSKEATDLVEFISEGRVDTFQTYYSVSGTYGNYRVEVYRTVEQPSGRNAWCRSKRFDSDEIAEVRKMVDRDPKVPGKIKSNLKGIEWSAKAAVHPNPLARLGYGFLANI
jgi:hypothetical protein